MGLFIALGVVVLLVLVILGTAVNLVQQGFNGVITRFGRYHKEVGSGICLIWPFFDRLVRVDMRETPRTGDRQDVITRDNVAVAVNATIFSQVIDAKAALFNVSNYFIAIDQQARTTLRNAFGNVSLDEALSSREQINAAMQQQMEQVTDKWGIRINRIEIVDISPPGQILQAMALQKQATRRSGPASSSPRASSSRRSTSPRATGRRRSSRRRASGRPPSSGPRVRGRRPSWRRRGAPWPSATSMRRSRRPSLTRPWSRSSSWTP